MGDCPRPGVVYRKRLLLQVGRLIHSWVRKFGVRGSFALRSLPPRPLTHTNICAIFLLSLDPTPTSRRNQNTTGKPPRPNQRTQRPSPSRYAAQAKSAISSFTVSRAPSLTIRRWMVHRLFARHQASLSTPLPIQRPSYGRLRLADLTLAEDFHESIDSLCRALAPLSGSIRPRRHRAVSPFRSTVER